MHIESDHRRRPALLGVTAVLLALPAAANAEPLPAAVAAMIDAAAADAATLKTVAGVAKTANPAAAAEIDARVAAIEERAAAARAAKLQAQTFSQGWSGEGQLGAFASTGNTSSTGIALGARLGKEGIHWKHRFDFAADYQRENGATSKERYFTGYGADYRLSPRLYALGRLSWERDRIAGYDSRFSEAVGLGYKIIDRPTLTLSGEGGPALRQTSFVSGGSDSSVNARVAADLKWKIGAATTFTETASWFIGGQSSTLTSEAALTTTLYRALSVRLSFFLQSESDPQPGRSATDTTSRVTLVYGF